MSTTPPGWYDDGHGALRWWDGTQWTDHVHTPDAPAAEAPAVPVTSDAPTEPAAAEPPAAEPAAPAAAESAPAAPAAYPVAPAAPGYPGAATTPGSPGQPGVPPGQPAEKPKSKLWILWVVLGGVVLLFVVLAVIFIPILVGLITSAASSSPSGAAGDDEAAAVAAVELYDDAWQDADCDAYEASTTSAYRDGIGISDCATFEREAEYFDESTDEYEIVIVDVTALDDGTIEVTTLESYLALTDTDGTPLEEPQQSADSLRYVLTDDGGSWLIEELERDE